MLPLQYHTISPYLRDKTRLTALSSGIEYGESQLSDNHIADRLEGILSHIENEEPHQLYSILRTRVYPDLSRERISDNRVASDILLPDTFRQHKGINERFHKQLPSIGDIRRLYEPITKYHIAISRGYERHLVDFITDLDSEMISRRMLQLGL